MSKFWNKTKSYFRLTDSIFWSISVSTSIFSLLLLLSVSRTSNFGYFRTQLIAIIIGYIGAFIITKSDYRIIAKHYVIVAVICVLLIICTLIFGTSVTGNSGIDAKAWLKLPGGISFQPSELAKIGFMITFSKHLSVLKEKNELTSFFNVALLGVHALVPIALTHLQGDDGAAIIFFFMFLFMAFAAGVQLRYFFAVFAAIILMIPILWNYVFAEYQKQRIINQINPEADPLNTGFQQIQGKISIGSGKIFGQGLFNGPRVGSNSVPIQESDFIFSVAGEELGFIGCTLIILLLCLMLFRTLKTASMSSDCLGTYICFGFFGLVASQTIFNLGMCLSVLPVMGVTLPFFSAGGSSSACLYLGIGLIQSVYIQRDDDDINAIISE
ncbi:cell cycle protein FtsW/RodA/SpoVE family [Clostridium sp. CAG:557]|jgi:rod shape determining protein RodA|nr:cell cycle protein FtsW/RodA/SpoVE family [Clostridium sp. CAG:557]